MDGPLCDRFLAFADVIMRVPPLFLIDELFRINLGWPGNNIAIDSMDDGFRAANMTIAGTKQIVYELPVIVIARFMFCCLGCIAALCTFMLWTKHLIIVYLYMISVGVIFISYWSNVSTMKAIIAYVNSHGSSTSILVDIFCLNLKHVLNEGPGFMVIQNYILQCLLASIFCYIHLAPRYSILQKLLVLSFLAPSIMGIHPLPLQVLYHAPVFATLLPLAVCKFVIWCNGISMLTTLYMGYQDAVLFASNYGISALAEIEWIRLNVPRVLRTFWILRTGEQAIQLLRNHMDDGNFTYPGLIRTLLANGCDTLTAVLGMTSIISVICHYIGCFFQWVLMTEDGVEKSFGAVSAVLFYLLALQTGLTSLDKEKRLVKLWRNICLLLSAVLHFVHNIVNPLLLSLSASHNRAVHRHFRALVVCAFLILFPVSLLVFLWSHFTVSTWLLSVSVFSIEVIVKVLVSLAVYSLFLIDAYRSTFWEQLDDCVYVIRCFGNMVEFAFGIILFFNGCWMLIFESGGTIRAVMMCIHAYFNIWCEAKAGWSLFMKRRTAVNKTNALPEAEAEQLRSLNDVCAICYEEMHTAKITRCNHYFHGVCLRKWLYIQDRCPLCHDILHKVDTPPSRENEPVPGTAGVAQERRDDIGESPQLRLRVAGSQNVTNAQRTLIDQRTVNAE